MEHSTIRFRLSSIINQAIYYICIYKALYNNIVYFSHVSHSVKGIFYILLTHLPLKIFCYYIFLLLKAVIKALYEIYSGL